MAVGLEDVTVGIYVEDERLVLECPACGAAFGRPGEALAHECADYAE